MEAVKKFLIFIIAMVIIIAIVIALPLGLVTLYSSETPIDELLAQERAASQDFKSSKVYSKDTPFYVAPNYNAHNQKSGYQYTYAFIKPIIETVDSAYIWGDYDNSGLTYAVSKESLEEKINTYNGGTINDLDKAVKTSKVLIQNATKKAREVYYPAVEGKFGKQKLYWSYSNVLESANEWRTLSAFEGVVSPEEFEDQSTPMMDDNILLLKGLDLKIENPVVEKVMCYSQTIAEDMYCMMISADVTTKKKPEEFNKCKWIPEKGETENITFVIITSSSNRHNTHFVSDLAVVGYN